MMIDLVNGGYEITDIRLPRTALILSGDKYKNLLLTVNIEEKTQLEKPVTLSPTVFQKLLTDMKTILPDDLNSGLSKIEQTVELGVPCVSFSFLTPGNELHITIFAEHFYLALNNMRGAGIV